MYETIYIHFPGYLSFERKILFVLLLIDRVVYSVNTVHTQLVSVPEITLGMWESNSQPV